MQLDRIITALKKNVDTADAETEDLPKAAVVVPIIAHEAAPTILLTKRPEHLSTHAGQIAFPGGRPEPRDTSLKQTALREMEEETAIPPAQTEIIGRLPGYPTVSSRYFIIPYVGLVTPPILPHPDPLEVEEIFEVPLSHFFSHPFQRHTARYGGEKKHFYAIQYEDKHIWGATAAILKNLVDLCHD